MVCKMHALWRFKIGKALKLGVVVNLRARVSVETMGVTMRLRKLAGQQTTEFVADEGPFSTTFSGRTFFHFSLSVPT